LSHDIVSEEKKLSAPLFGVLTMHKKRREGGENAQHYMRTQSTSVGLCKRVKTNTKNDSHNHQATGTCTPSSITNNLWIIMDHFGLYNIPE
jgi:hypothetical protein